MKNNPIMKMGVVLFAVCLVAGILLGGANALTEELIAEKKESVNQAAYAKVLPGATDLTLMDLDYDETTYSRISEVYESSAGYAIKVIGKGYAGDDIEIAIGLDKSGTVTGMSIISHSETPGLGANATNESFLNQYVGKNASSQLTVVKNGASSDTQIDALTGATKTSNGVTDAVNLVFRFYQQYLA